MKRWYVVHTLGGQERLADDSISKRGHETFFPKAGRTVLHGRRKEFVLRPLYPCYLFVAFDPLDLSWGEILHLPGVFTIIGIMRPSGRPKSFTDSAGAKWMAFPGRPRAVPDGVIENIQRWVADVGGVIQEPTKRDELKKDTPVKLTDGAFAGWEGLVDVHVGTRVRVLLDIMGRETPINVLRDSLAILSPP